MRPELIRHLTLETGEQLNCRRNQVADEDLAVLRPLLDRAIAGEAVRLPFGDPPCSITASVGPERALRVTVWAPPVHEGPVPLVTIGVAPTAQASTALWTIWFGRARDDMTPAPPWCVVQMRPGLVAYPRAADWLGDLEVCIAWAWVDS